MINNIANRHVSATPKDLTINVKVVNLYNVDIGEYKVEYQGNTFSAFSSDPTVTYSLDEHVYVLVPQGDFSQRKIILGRAAGEISDSEAQDLTNFFIDQGPNWYSIEDNTYPPDHTPLQICAVTASSKNSLKRNPLDPKAPNYEDQGFRRWTPEALQEPREPSTRYPVTYPTEEELERIDGEFQNYAKFYDWIKIAADFRTEFLSTHTNGQYYLEATFIANNPKWVPEDDPRYELRKDEEKYLFISYKLEFKNFNGAPYQMPVATPQKAYFQIDPGVLKGLYKVSLKQDGRLVCDVKPSYDSDGNLVYKVPEDNILDKNNIFADNIEIRFCKRINLLDTPYFVWIEMPKGDSLYGPQKDHPGKESIELVPHMYHYAQEVTKDCKIMWFREDLSIPEENNPSDEDRDEDGRVWTFYTGPGWRPIEQFIDDRQQPYEIREDNVLEVKIESVKWQWRYKLVCIYTPAEGSPFGEDIATVIRSDSPYDLFIENFTDKGSNKEMARISDHKKKVGVDINPKTGRFYPEWFGTWYTCLDDNSYDQIQPPYLNGPLALNPFLIYEHVLFRVACYDPMEVNPPNGDYNQESMVQVEEIGYLTYELNSAQDTGLLISWEGQKSFNYTALGKCYDHVSSKEYTLAPKLSWAHDASAYDLQILAPDGQPLGSRNYYNPDAVEIGEGGVSVITGNGYTPNSSMMYDMYQDSNNVLHFKVRQEYDADRIGGTKNTVKCIVRTIKDDMWYESTCEVVFTKDGQQGTQGTGWTAPLALTNGVAHRTCVVDNKTGEKIVNVMPAYTHRLGLPTYPMVLHKDPITGLYSQDLTQSRIFLRPFVTKDGKALESLNDMGPERDNYRLKIYWDVSFPQNARNPKARGASFLRLHKVGDRGPIAEVGGELQKEVQPKGAPGIVCMTTWEPGKQGEEEYGTVEVKYEPGAGIKDEPLQHEDVMYQFIVKAVINIETKLATDEIKRKMGSSMGEFIREYDSTEWHRIKSITSWFAVDVFVENNPNEKYHFDPLKCSCNWPTDLQYDSRGKNPIIDADYLEFYYGYFPDAEIKTSENGQFIKPNYDYSDDPNGISINLTPTVQTVEQTKNPLLEDKNYKEKFESEQQYQTAISKLPEFTFKLKPKSELNWQEGTVGVLYGQIIGDSDKQIPSGTFYRNQIYHCNTYDNVDINSWDGQGIDINEDNGTIFAPTIGAGFKGPLTNTFTGVLMGVNTGFLRQTEGIVQYTSIAEQELNTYPYMTGIFGYQCGYASFGILENGTAFFGRKDRGGRIIIDGYNATIYGGANGELSSPEIGDPMWNNMRLTFVDLTHATSGYENTYTNANGIIEKQDDGISTINDDDPTSQGNTATPTTTAVQGIRQGFDGAYFGDGRDRGDISGVSSELPPWYKETWERAFIKGNRSDPWWLDWGKVNPPTEKDGMYDYAGQEEYSDEMKNYWLDYWNPNLQNVRKLMKIGEDAKTKNLTGFGPSRASTTPAIEIGQHPRGLMPGLLEWGSQKTVFRNLWIPGDRNFMVTYDGTLWAMNGVFMGNVIGSNILGGRLQGVEMGIGDPKDVKVENIWVVDEETSCLWSQLEPAKTRRLRDDEIEGIFGAFTVHNDGTVIANKLMLWGGQIDLGSFHILGVENDSGYGDLIQFGHSDFVGPTHFYGNVGIGPNLGDGTEPRYEKYHADRGNLFQTNGYAALGIILPDKELFWHKIFCGEDGNMQVEEKYYAGPTTPGNPGILDGSGESIEQSAMFTVNTYKQEKITGAEDAGYAGHFWPMAYRYSKSSIAEKAQGEGPTFDGVHSYMTVMDIFKSKPFSINNGVGSDRLPSGDSVVDGGNYFRAGPWGMEFIRGYICQDFQPENTSLEPSPSRKFSPNTKGGVRGVIGLVNRGGGGGATSQAIGMTSWGKAPIIISSDENCMIKTKNWMSLRANAADEDKVRDDDVDSSLIEGIGGFLAELSMGDVLSSPAIPSAVLKVHASSKINRKARAVFGIVNWDDPDGTSRIPLAHQSTGVCGLQFTPEHSEDGVRPGNYLFSRQADIHIVRYPDKAGTIYCQDAKNITEGLFRQDEIVFYAKNRVTIAWGEGQGAHTDPGNWKHAAIFTGDGIQVINDGSASGGPPTVDPDPGTGGGGQSNPPTPAQPGEKKYCIYLGDQDNKAGISEITWQTNFVSISGKQVWIGGADSQAAHNPSNFMLFAQNSIDMRGAYATPDNQFHIYARFG